MGTTMPHHHFPLKIYFFDFLKYFDQVPICPNLALKCHLDVLLAKYYLTGCFACPTDVECGPWGKECALSVKMGILMSETDSIFDFYHILKFFN